VLWVLIYVDAILLVFLLVTTTPGAHVVALVLSAL